VACVGLTNEERLVTAKAQEPGNTLVLVGNATGRDGLGGASFASEDLAEDAETADRPAVQVGDPYAEKLLIEANEQLVDEGLIESARDLGAAGLGGASSEMVAKADLGARIELERVHQREPNMNAMEILLAESQERMCYEVKPENVDRVHEIVERFDLGCSVIGEVTDENYTCLFEGETVVDVDAYFLGEGAPMNDLATEELEEEPRRTCPTRTSRRPSTRSSRVRTPPQSGGSTGSTTTRSACGRASDRATTRRSSRCERPSRASQSPLVPRRTGPPSRPTRGSRGRARERDEHRGEGRNAAGRGGLPQRRQPGEAGRLRRLHRHRRRPRGEMCETLSTPVVGGNVSLYNDSVAGPIPPTPTLAMVGSKDGYDAPLSVESEGDLVLVGDLGLERDESRLGGSEYLARFDGSDRFPGLPADPASVVETLAAVANDDSTLAVHDVSHGGLAVALAEWWATTRASRCRSRRRIPLARCSTNSRAAR